MTKLVYCLLSFVLIHLACSQFIITNITKFPLPLGKPFEITVSINPSSGLTLELMVIQTTDLNGFDKEVAIFDFGLKEVISQEFQSDYMRIPTWGKFEEGATIYTMINFTQYANNRILEIYYINPNSTKERRNMLNHLKPTQLMYRNNINLLVPPQLELKMNSQVRNYITVEPNSSLTVSCQALDGQPKVRPEIVKSDMKIEFDIFSHDSNTHKITIRTSMLDHNRTVTCKAGSVMKSVRIFIYHAPTKIKLQPEVKKVLGNNTGIICLATNGYPTPRITWYFIHGPSDASLYYQIAPYTQRLYIKENVPIGSSWKFICSATNSFFERSKTFNKTVSFTIIHQQRNKTQTYYNTSKIKTSIWDPDQMNYTLKQIEEIKLEIFVRDITITNLKDSIGTLNSEIFQLNQTIQQLRETQRETSSDIKMFKKIFNIEIESLKKELNNLNGNLIDKNKVNQTQRNSAMTTTPSASLVPIISFDWRINGVSRLRRKEKSFRSVKFVNPKIRFPVTLYFKFRRMESMFISVRMSHINDAESSLVIKGYVTLSIYNAEDVSKQMSTRNFFERNRRSTNVDFVFNYFELHMNQVLQSDDIIVKCSLSISS